MSAGSSKATKSGCVQKLNNYIQCVGQNALDIKYSTPREGTGDKFTITVTLPNKTSYTGTAVGKQAAKEEAAYSALRALGQI